MNKPKRTLSIFVAAILSATVGSAADKEGEVALDLPPELMGDLFDTTVSVDLRGGLGYKDNVLLTEKNPIRSVFARADVDAFVWKPPVALTDVYWALTGSESRYFDAPSDAKSERVWLTQGELRYAIGTYFKAGLTLQGYYQDQVLDLSTGESAPLRARFKVYGISGGPNLRWEIRNPWWFEISAVWKLEKYENVNQDYDEPATVLRLGRKFGKRHDLSVAWLWKGRDYHDRNAYTIGGRPLPDTHLGTHWNDLELRFVSRWTSQLTSTLKFSEDRLRDSSSGYFDYNHWRADVELLWKRDPWRIRVSGMRGVHDYLVQVSGTGFDPPLRQIRQTRVDGSVERKITDRVSVFGEVGFEDNKTDDPGGSYRLNTVFAGVSYEF